MSTKRKVKKTAQPTPEITPDTVIVSLLEALPGRVIVIWDNECTLKAFVSEGMGTAEAIGILELTRQSTLKAWMKP